MPGGVDLSGRRLYIHGSDTEVLATQGATFSSASAGPRITLGRMTIRATAGTAVSASNNGALELDQVTLIDAGSAAGGSLQLRRSSFGDLHCTTGGILRVEGSSGGAIDSIGCAVTVRASRFATSVTTPLLSLDGGSVVVENSTFVSTDPGTDPLTILHTIAGSRFAFNSVVNFSGLDGTATNMSCDVGLDVSSSIFAWHSSGTPPLVGCTAHDSLFDELVPAAQIGSNHQANAAAMFVDFNGKDLHLSAASPARALGVAGIVDVDLEGKPRPNPAGSRPDAGAYEAP